MLVEITRQLSLVFAGAVIAIFVGLVAFRRDQKVKQQDRLRAAYVDMFVAMNIELAITEPLTVPPVTYVGAYDPAPEVNYEEANHELAVQQASMDRFKESTRALYVLAMLESDQTFMADIRALALQLGNLIGGTTAQREGEQLALMREINGFVEKIRLSHPLLKAA